MSSPRYNFARRIKKEVSLHIIRQSVLNLEDDNIYQIDIECDHKSGQWSNIVVL